MKRCLAVLLCVCLCCAALPCARAEDAPDGELICTLDEGVANAIATFILTNGGNDQ